ncbi:MAG: histidine kinase [Saprospiraceae bacterium]|nr:histidine kinase [Saprospiraceae bacterium]
MKNIISDKYKTILFHICLWGIWLYLPLSNTRDEELYTRTIQMFSFIFLTHIPLFFINTEWLIPKILHKKGTTTYFWLLLGFILVFAIWHNLVGDWVKNILDIKDRGHRNLTWSLVPIIFVTAISTGYGLFNYVVKEEKVKQEAQQERLQSELSFLRSQISPHFIFNILNSIVYLIRTKSDLAEPVTIKLSELMRYMLYESESAQIPLDKELTYLSNYIELQKVRFEDDVAIKLHTEGEVTNQIIEPMLMIPFVENAFKHGVGMILNPIIDISIKITENELFFNVRNKIAPESAEDKDSSSGIGLRNVKRRLELLYPHKHQLDIKDTEGWFEVNLNLKFN